MDVQLDVLLLAAADNSINGRIVPTPSSINVFLRFIVAAASNDGEPIIIDSLPAAIIFSETIDYPRAKFEMDLNLAGEGDGTNVLHNDDPVQIQAIATELLIRTPKDGGGTDEVTERNVVIGELSLSGRQVLDLHPARQGPLRQTFFANTINGRVKFTLDGVYRSDGADPVIANRDCLGWACGGAGAGTSGPIATFSANPAWPEFTLETVAGADTANVIRCPNAREASDLGVKSASGNGPAPVLVLSATMQSKTTTDETSASFPRELLRTSGVAGRATVIGGCNIPASVGDTSRYQKINPFTCPSSSSGGKLLAFSKQTDGIMLALDAGELGLDDSFSAVAIVKFDALPDPSKTVAIFTTNASTIFEHAVTRDFNRYHDTKSVSKLIEDIKYRALSVAVRNSNQIECCLGARCAITPNTLRPGQFLAVGCSYDTSNGHLTAVATNGYDVDNSVVDTNDRLRRPFGTVDALFLGAQPFIRFNRHVRRLEVRGLGGSTGKPLDWTAAGDACRALGGVFATTLGQLDHQDLTKDGGRYWIGLNSLGAENQ